MKSIYIKIVCKLIVSILLIGPLYADLSYEQVNKLVNESIKKKDYGIGLKWADESSEYHDYEKWIKILRQLKTDDCERNHVIFSIFARCCLFAPRDAQKLFNQKELKRMQLPIVLYDSTRSILAPIQKRRYLESGGTIVGITISCPSGQPTKPAMMYIGISRKGWRIGDSLEVSDIDFVDTEFELLWNMTR